MLFCHFCHPKKGIALTQKSPTKTHIQNTYGDFPVCKQRLKCRLCFPAQSAKRRRTQTKADFHLFLPPFSSHSVRHRLPLLGYPLSGKSTHQLSNYKRKNYWIYKLSIYFLDLIRRAFMYRLLDDRQFRMHGLGRSSSA